MTDEQFKELQEMLTSLQNTQQTILKNMRILEANLTIDLEGLHTNVNATITNTQLLLQRQTEQNDELTQIKTALNK